MRRKLLNIKMVLILAALLVLFIAVGIAEEDITDASGQWKYVVEDGCATITGFVGEPPEDLVFPSELDGYPVTVIGSWASDDVNVVEVTGFEPAIFVRRMQKMLLLLRFCPSKCVSWNTKNGYF